MGLSKPFFRITRPGAFIPDYVMDKRYAPDRLQLSRAYISIEKDLRSIFDYIEPDDKNINAFSFELYSLLLRACTEVELNCKEIMVANGAIPEGRHFTMKDYKKLEKATLLSKYKAVFRNWRRKQPNSKVVYEEKVFQPFINFGLSPQKSPDWYDAYNQVKNNREEDLEKASLENCMNAVSGILILLYLQFGSRCIATSKTGDLLIQTEDADDFLFQPDVLFVVHTPSKSDWDASQLYDFQWDNLKKEENPFARFFEVELS